MAKPIRSTPALKGEEAVIFIKNMMKEEKNPDPKRVATIKRALKSNFEIIN